MATGEYGFLEFIASLEEREAELEAELARVRAATSLAREEMNARGIRAKLSQNIGDVTEDKAKSDVGRRKGPYKGMTPRKAALVFLKELDRPATTAEIREALKAGNVKTRSKKFHQTLYNTLQRMAQIDHSVVNLGAGVWGLAEN